jgi:hypothetical protein
MTTKQTDEQRLKFPEEPHDLVLPDSDDTDWPSEFFGQWW